MAAGYNCGHCGQPGTSMYGHHGIVFKGSPPPCPKGHTFYGKRDVTGLKLVTADTDGAEQYGFQCPKGHVCRVEEGA